MNNPNAVIVWLLQNRDYDFREGSIRFKGDNAADCNREFDSHSHSKRVYNVTDRVSRRIECRYEITVYDGAGKPHKLDPTIVNN